MLLMFVQRSFLYQLAQLAIVKLLRYLFKSTYLKVLGNIVLGNI